MGGQFCRERRQRDNAPYLRVKPHTSYTEEKERRRQRRSAHPLRGPDPLPQPATSGFQGQLSRQGILSRNSLIRQGPQPLVGAQDKCVANPGQGGLHVRPCPLLGGAIEGFWRATRWGTPCSCSQPCWIVSTTQARRSDNYGPAPLTHQPEPRKSYQSCAAREFSLHHFPTRLNMHAWGHACTPYSSSESSGTRTSGNHLPQDCRRDFHPSTA